MGDTEILEMLRVDLGITTDAYDMRLSQYIKSARKEIAREGATLTNCIDDAQLVIMYAAWLWRRRDSMDGMPRMLRYALNNRVLAEKMAGGE